MDVGLLIVGALSAGILLLFMFNGPAKKKNTGKIQGGNLDKNLVAEKWHGIEMTASLNGPSNFKSAILEADKLIDYVLKGLRIPGETMGARLKNVKTKFKDYNDYNNLWFAHKVRNNIAHEVTHEINSAETKRAIEYYKKALKILGVL